LNKLKINISSREPTKVIKKEVEAKARKKKRALLENDHKKF
jgi:hypothetical protein